MLVFIYSFLPGGICEALRPVRPCLSEDLRVSGEAEAGDRGDPGVRGGGGEPSRLRGLDP